MAIHERKYKIKDDRLVKRDTEIPIPENEPVFIFRAKDRKALAALVAYGQVVDNLDQREAVMKSVEDFRRFQENNPDLMDEPRP